MGGGKCSEAAYGGARWNLARGLRGMAGWDFHRHFASSL